MDKIDDKFYIIIAVEPGNDGPYGTAIKAEMDKKINLKAGRYIRIRRDSHMPNKREKFELLKKLADLLLSMAGTIFTDRNRRSLNYIWHISIR